MPSQARRSARERIAGRKPQPLDVLQIEDALLTIETVCAVTAQSPSSVCRGVAARTFPAPIKRGIRCTRWVSADVSAWLKSQRSGA